LVSIYAFSPNRTFSEVRELINVHAANPLREFSEECRAELRALNNSSARA
jgi:hypothetical protein